MFTVKSNFIGSFKIGDNICHNLAILKLLYRYFGRATDENKVLLCKPIVVSLVSITEAAIYDLHYRAKTFTREGLAGIPDSAIEYIRTAELRDYDKQIGSARRHRLLGDNIPLYEKLHELRKLRNRIHIQNSRGQFEPDESDAFNLTRKRQAEKTTQFVLSYCSLKYPRASHCHYVQDFKLPWKKYNLPGLTR